jgi:hypothetical protein
MDDNTYELLLNTFMIYYKKVYPNDKIKTMFDNINREGDTNKPLEIFYECIVDYNHSNYQEALDYTTDNINNLDKNDFYVLKDNNVNIKFSDNIISLLIEVINNNYSNWSIDDLN